MVSGNLPTQLSLITSCHSPGTGAFSLAQGPKKQDRTWAHGVTSPFLPPRLQQTLTVSGQRRPRHRALGQWMAPSHSRSGKPVHFNSEPLVAA